MSENTWQWAVLENIVTLLLACGLTALFYHWTQSGLSFLWLLLLLNINTPRHKKE
jgi:hypothetical protein